MLPNPQILAEIPRKIFSIPNQRKESKREIHYCCYLLCEKAGLRVSEAVNFDLNARTRKGLYHLNKTKGKKKRYVYIPKKVIKELKKHGWKPNSTNRFNFYHFLRKIGRKLGISKNVELTPHTLRRAFATYQAEAGLPLPLLSKLLGHKSVRTTALYWMNIYQGGDDDDDSDIGGILAGGSWLERPRRPQPGPEAPAQVNLEELPELLTPKPLTSEQPSNYLNEIQQLKSQLSQIKQKNNNLKEQNTNLQNDLSELSEQNAYETTQREQIQQDLATAKQTINQLTQDLARERKFSAEQKQISHNLRQQLLTEQETNANLKQKLHSCEQNLTNLQNAYQNAIKAKERTEKQLNNLVTTIKIAAKQFQQWQKLNYYQQLEQERNELKAQIIQPPPWKNK